MEAAAYVALAGLNPMAFLRTKDALERATMQAIADRVKELEHDRDLNRARMIANEVLSRIK